MRPTTRDLVGAGVLTIVLVLGVILAVVLAIPHH